MPAILDELGVDSVFGDNKAEDPATLEKLEPDFLIINKTGTIQCVGEAKTPWMHDLSKVFGGPTY
jgi:hypothetical protein